MVPSSLTIQLQHSLHAGYMLAHSCPLHAHPPLHPFPAHTRSAAPTAPLLIRSMRLLSGSLPFVQPLSAPHVTAVCTLASTLAVARSPASLVRGSCCAGQLLQLVCRGLLGLQLRLSWRPLLALSAGIFHAHAWCNKVWLLHVACRSRC